MMHALKEHMPPNFVRPIAIALLKWQAKYLVFEAYDPLKKEYFYRPLGGGIDFGEYGHQAIKREIMEEIGAKICDIRYVFTLENIYKYNGEPGHEIVQVYEAKLEDSSLHGKDIEAVEDNGQTFHCVWKSLEEIKREGRPLYPDGLPEKLQETVLQK